MEKLNIRFKDTTALKISDLAKSANLSDSDIGRIAMMWGLSDLTTEIAKSGDNLKDRLTKEALKAKQ